YSADGTLDLLHHQFNGNLSSKLSFKFTSNFNETYDTLMQEMARNYIQQIFIVTVPEFNPLPPELQQRNPDELYAAVASAVPNLHSLGKLTQALDISYDGNERFTDGDVNLAA